jgi:hypothetical protein
VEEEQRGEKRAGYGEQWLGDLSRRLQADFGRGYSVDNLEWFRQFYLVYPHLVPAEKPDAARRISDNTAISDAVRRKSSFTQDAGGLAISHTLRAELEIRHTLRGESDTWVRNWKAGQLHLIPGARQMT